MSSKDIRAMLPTTSNKISSMTGVTKVQKSTPVIHPLFRESQFVGISDYNTVFRNPAILATRLLDSPQALHWGYACIYGVNSFAARPDALPQSQSIRPRDGIRTVPMQYACNKGIGQLSAEDISSVRQHFVDLADCIHFKVTAFNKPGRQGQCTCADPSHDGKGYNSIIEFSDILCKLPHSKHKQTAKEIATVDLYIANIMLQEIVHALNFKLMGPRVEDFFETSFVAENGWELQSRIFGMVPYMNDANPSDTNWHTWQTHSLSNASYNLDKICRHSWKLPKEQSRYHFDPQFAVMLCSDAFWENEYVQRGALALIPTPVRNLCRSTKRTDVTRGIPQSIRDLFRDSAKSYAEKKYARFANPQRTIRSAPEEPEG